ncbi:MAG TPA: threonine-phosphate decarboxylase [Syntrophomonas sp.]|nr:threonine-phosphate decarboxylase [Syntrophomonas sp.]
MGFGNYVKLSFFKDLYMEAVTELQNNSLKNVHGGNVWQAAQKWGIRPDQFIDYSANINPLGMSPRAIAALKDNLNMLIHYPEPSGEGFKNSLSIYLHVAPENLVLGNGGSELIYLVGRMYYGSRIVVLAPSFSEYGAGIEQPDIKHICLKPEQNFALPVRKIIEEIREGDLLFIANPNNPTGNLFPSHELEQIVTAAGRSNAVVVIDEAFIDFAGDKNSLRYLAQENSNLIILGSLTKFFAMPSLRLGYAVSTVTNINRMEQLLPVWRINAMAMVAGEASISHREYIEQTLSTIKTERQFLSRELGKIEGLQVYPSESNFILLNALHTGFTAHEIQDQLGPKGILIRECSNFINLSPFYFRLAVKAHKENERLVKALRDVLKS